MLSLSACVAIQAADEKKGVDDGFVSIFDGKTLDGWEVSSKKGEKAWTVEDGYIAGDGDKGGRGYLVYAKDKELANFELKLSYRFPKVGKKANSGVSIRAVKDKTRKRDFQSYHADIGHVGIGKNDSRIFATQF